MSNEILIFRTDRIGDLITTCPAISSLKKKIENSKITLIASRRNYAYAKQLDFLDNVYIFPDKGIIRKIIFIFKFLKKRFFRTFIFDGKDRSLLLSLFIKSDMKIGIYDIKKKSFLYNFFNIKLIQDDHKTGMMKLYQKVIDAHEPKIKISNFDFVHCKKDNNFSSYLPIKNYIYLHLDEKWFSKLYINTYTDICPSYDEFINFLTHIAKNKKNILISTGIKNFELINNLKKNFFNFEREKIYLKKIDSSYIYFIYNANFEDLESLLRKAQIYIGCHGSLTHVANSLNLQIIDIIQNGYEEWYNRWTNYMNNYSQINRMNFREIKNILLSNILKS